jgi:hypothetical protein
MKRGLPVLFVVALWAVAANAQAKSDREHAGLRGAVQSVRTEVSEFAPEGGGSVEGRRRLLQTITYNARGDRVKLVDYNHDGSVAQTLVHTFDGLGRNNGYEEYTGGLKTPRRHVYVLDDRGRRIEYSFVQPDGSAGEKCLYRYDARGNVVEETLHGHKGELISRNVLAYDEEGRQVSQTRYNADGSVSAIISNSYDAQGKPVERVRHEGDTLTYRVRYFYDRRMRVAAQETVGSVVEPDVNPSEAHAPGRVVYVYKGKGQPAETIAYAPDGSVREKVYIEYDSRGNWIKRTHLIGSRESGRRESRRIVRRAITYGRDVNGITR